jgi:hypothetical protein
MIVALAWIGSQVNSLAKNVAELTLAVRESKRD